MFLLHLLKGFRQLGAVVDVQIPDRIKDGYGINESIIRKAAADGIDTIVTCDNGISAIPEIALAKDFGMTSKAITEILTKYATTPKNHMQVLEDQELSLVFEYLTQQNQCASMEDLFKVPEAKPAPSKPEPQPEQAQSAQPQQSQARPQQPQQQPQKPQQPQAAQAQPQPQAQSQQAKEQKPHVPRQVPEKRVIDTRGGGNVNLGKYDERFDRLAGAHGGDNVKRGKEKFQNKQKQRQQQTKSSLFHSYLISHPLTAPSTIPLTKCFCANG